MRKYNPDTIAPPIGAYTQAIELAAGTRVLHISGQVAVDPAGQVPAGIAAQTDVVFANIEAILKAAGMGLADIVKLNTYLVEPDDMPGFAAARGRWMGDMRPCSTLVFVKALVRPEYIVEIEAIAAVTD